MKKETRRSIIRISKLFYYVVAVLLFAYVWFKHYNSYLIASSPRRFGVAFVGVYCLFFHFLVRTYEGLTVGVSKVSELVYSLSLACVICDCIMFVIAWLLNNIFPPVLPMVALFGVQVLFSTLWVVLSDLLYFKIYKVRKAVAIYFDNRDYERLVDLNSVSRKFRVERKICVTGEVDQSVLDQLEGMDAVFVRGLPANERNDILKHCVQNGIEVYLWPKIGDVLIAGAEHTQMFHVPMMYLRRYSPNLEYLLVKRAFDIFVSLLGIIISLPFMVLTALAIKLHDGGPVLYKQVRLTKDEREFKILKFRSMRVDAEKDGVARLSTGDTDDRVTPVGKVIRAIRFDELPQLFNILKGDMSIVGPRPERPEIAAQYVEQMPEFRLRLQAKAGLTGYAQVYGKYNSLPYDKLQMDLLYISNPSFLEDIRIMFATVKILFLKESTEGVAEGQITASACDESEKEESGVL